MTNNSTPPLGLEQKEILRSGGCSTYSSDRPGKPVSEHILEMKGRMDQLHTLGKPYDNDMAVNLINIGYEQSKLPHQPNQSRKSFERKENPNKVSTLSHQLRHDLDGHLEEELPSFYIDESWRANKKKFLARCCSFRGDLKKKGNYLMGIIYASGQWNNKQLLEAIGMIDIMNGVFEIDINNTVPNSGERRERKINSIFKHHKKRKLELDSTDLLAVRLAHIGKTSHAKASSCTRPDVALLKLSQSISTEIQESSTGLLLNISKVSEEYERYVFLVNEEIQIQKLNALQEFL
ncbi:hypothetical protein Tco_0643274 [Tanacetum coccineum]